MHLNVESLFCFCLSAPRFVLDKLIASACKFVWKPPRRQSRSGYYATPNKIQ